MPRGKTEWNQEKIDRFIQQGRGSGRGDDYLPWINVGDLASRGKVTRVKSQVTNRVHHFFSENQTRVFYLLEWSGCTDIREHYPILDMDDYKKELSDVDLNKYRDKKSGCPYIFTTTFLSNWGDNKKAISVTSSYELKKNTILIY